MLGAIARTYARGPAASFAIVVNVATVIALALVLWTFFDAILPNQLRIPEADRLPKSVTVDASVEGAPSRAVAALAKEILDYESGQVIEETGVLDVNVARNTEPLRNMSGIAFLMGAVALLLTVTGIYGGVGEAVSQSGQSLAI